MQLQSKNICAFVVEKDSHNVRTIPDLTSNLISQSRVLGDGEDDENDPVINQISVLIAG